MDKASLFWKELKRRKVLSFFIGYLGAGFALVEFLSLSSSRFKLSDHFFDLYYLVAAIGVPFAIVLPWIINRKEDEGSLTALHETETKPIARRPLINNFPAKLTDFIGRRRETEQVRALVNEHRILTVTGSGGCGKTRLVCEVAERLVHNFSDGIWFVDLAPVSTGDMVSRQVAEALEVNEDAGRDLIDTLIQHSKYKNLLIILDNCEHLISACSRLCATLLKSIPGLQIIATSREALKISGEKIWRIPSLSLINPGDSVSLEEALGSEAVALFVNRALMVDPSFELTEKNVRDVTDICNKLEGIPLAIEIVASRSSNMSPRIIRERLADRFDLLGSRDVLATNRQKTLHSTIEWGYNLLSEEEKLLYERLSVFAGNIELNTAEKICSDEHLTEGSILDLLSTLTDKSMIQMVKNADQSLEYSLYETLRLFAFQKLQSRGSEHNARMRHLHFYVELSARANEERNTAQSAWLKRLEKEHDNLIAALEWSDQHAQDKYIKISGNLAWFWVWRSHFQTGMHFLEKAEARGIKKSPSHARILAGMGTISLFSGDPVSAIKYLEDSINLWQEINHPGEQAIVLNELGLTYCMIGDNKRGLEIGKEGHAMAQKAGDPATINHCLGSVAQAMVSLKQLAEVRPLAEQMLIDSRKFDQPLMLRLANHFLADCDLMQNRFQEAERNYGLALGEARESGNTLFVCIELLGVAMSVSGQRRHAKAMRLAAASTEFTAKSGYIDPEKLGLKFWSELVKKHLLDIRAGLDHVLNQQYEKEGREMNMAEAIEYALNTEI